MDAMAWERNGKDTPCGADARHLLPSENGAYPCHTLFGMQRSRAWCGTPPILGVVNMVGTQNFTCYMGAL